MSDKVEGTIVLDGLVEGRLADEEGADRLGEWVSFCKSNGLRFTLDHTLGAFSIMPVTEAQSVEEIGEVPHEVIRQAMEQLMEAIGEETRGSVYSTLRSMEYRKGEEVQAVYLADPSGSVSVETRTVDAKTVGPPAPIEMKDKLKVGLMGLVVALALVGVASLFLDLGELFSGVVNTLTPTSVKEIKIDLSGYEEVITEVSDERKMKGGKAGGLQITLKRGDRFPASDEAYEKAIQGAKTARERMAYETLMRGYLRVELFEKENKFVGVTEIRVAGLKNAESAVVVVPLPRKVRVKRLVFGY